MARKPVTDQACPNEDCDAFQSSAPGNVTRHGFYRSKLGRRRRYRCSTCGVTFGSGSGTPYYRIQSSRSRFDTVAAMSVEGMSKSSISRVTDLAWNTVDRWLEKAAAAAREFNDVRMRGFTLRELQADELRTIVGSKTNVTWIFTTTEVWSRLWPSCVVGRRSYRNTHEVISDTVQRGELDGTLLVAFDGFEYYPRVIETILGIACVYGQIVKTFRNNRVQRIERRQPKGMKQRLEDALSDSEDSTKLNTSFIERLNLTLRQGSAYLGRRTLSHARCARRLEDHLELLRCHYNFIRPHRSLKVGAVTRTPAQQAGIATKRWSFRAVFMARGSGRLLRVVVSCVRPALWPRAEWASGRRAA